MAVCTALPRAGGWLMQGFIGTMNVTGSRGGSFLHVLGAGRSGRLRLSGVQCTLSVWPEK